MTIALSGTLLTPTGAVAANAGIRITSLGLGINDLGKGVVTEYQCSAAGVYSFNLINGTHRIDYRFGNEWINQGEVIVNDDLPAGTDTLYELFNATTPVTPAVVQQLQQILADTQTAETNAATSASEAASSAATATNAVRAMTQQDFEARRAINNEQYAASGFVHFGQHLDDGLTYYKINEGMWSHTLLPNSLIIGDHLGRNGTSKLNEAQVNLSSITSRLTYLNTTIGRAYIKFPEAPNGTVTYDSATGTVTDYSTEVDPKYGDVAGTVNEAVARAFEGEVKNGDFRNGTTDWSVSAANQSVTDNKLTMTATSNGGQTTSYYEATQGTGYELEFYVHSLSGQCIYLLQHTTVMDTAELQLGLNTIKFTHTDPTTATSQLVFRGSLAGNSCTVSDVSIRKTTKEVVTDRVDMYGLEGFLEEVNTTNPYIYPNGLIQSQATTMNGITTGASNRPDTYYAVFDGDTTSKGKGVDYFALSEANKIKVLGDPDNNLYRLDDGRLVQWRIRQRTIAGAGNGDWFNVSAATTANSSSAFLGYAVGNNAGRAATMQGSSVTPSLNYAADFYTPPSEKTYNLNPVKGLFSGRSATATNFAVNGECYFLVLGTVSRLNQGAYHPSFNPSGARAFVQSGKGYAAKWHEITGLTGIAQCFNLKGSVDDLTEAGSSDISGYIGSPSGSGRPDGRFYDAIYADGLGGVVDYRWSAFDKSSAEEASKVRQAVKNGSYRGLEKLVRTRFDTQLSTTTASDKATAVADSSEFTIGDICYIEQSDGTYHKVTLTNVVPNVIYWNYSIGGRLQNGIILHEKNLDTSVSGDFTTTDVIGNPANILATEALAEGWTGRWIPIIPDGTGTQQFFELVRKNTNAPTSIDLKITTDAGATWSVIPQTPTATTNNIFLQNSNVAGVVCLVEYTAFAKQTKPTNNTTVLNGESGLGSVFSSNSYIPIFGNILSESLLSKVLKSNVDRMLYDDHLIGQYIALNSGKLLTNGDYPIEHHPTALAAPTNNSPAVKSLMYQVDSNSQASLNFAYKEMIYDVTWGDDDKIDIANGDNTKTDLNGNTIQYGTHELAIPYGWIKNEV